jgi:hypothetical protein
VARPPRRRAARLEIAATCAGAPLAEGIVMPRHLASPFVSGLARVALVAALALTPGCKSMGGVMSGLGKATAGAARGVAHAAPAIARGTAHAGGAIASGVAHATPSVLRATEAVIETAADVVLSTPIEIEVGPGIMPPPSPRVGDDDPCQACSLDDCGVCVGYAGYACVAAPAGALAHCESSAPPDAPPAPAPPAAAPSGGGPPAAAPPAPPLVIPAPGAAGSFRL